MLSLGVMFTFASFTSCSNDETIREESSTVKVASARAAALTANDIGKYHNIAVDLYLDNSDGKRHTVKEIQTSVVKLMTTNYPDLMKGFAIPKETNFISPVYNEYSITQAQLGDIMKQGFGTLSKTYKLSGDLSSTITSVSTSGASYEDMSARVAQYKTISDDEFKFVETYSAVLGSSNTVWANRKIKCSSKVLAADAVGAALGLFATPLWSIIQGAVVSIAVNEDCPGN